MELNGKTVIWLVASLATLEFVGNVALAMRQGAAFDVAVWFVLGLGSALSAAVVEKSKGATLA